MDAGRLILVCGALAIVAVAVCAVLLVAILRRRTAKPAAAPVDLTIDVGTLDTSGPTGEFPQLEYLGRPVRLAALVVAPVGRSGAIPEADRLLDAVDQLIPGLVDVISTDHPLVRFWPGQLSTQGFAHAFFRNVKLPGERGVGTRWCSAAGKFKAGDRVYLAGLLCAASEPNELGEVAVEENQQWSRILQVRRS